MEPTDKNGELFYIIKPFYSYVAGGIIVSLTLIISWAVITAFYPKESLSHTISNKAVERLYHYLVGLGAAIVIGFSVRIKKIPIVHRGVLKIFGTRYPSLLGYHLLMDEGYHWYFPGVIEYEIGSLKTHKMSVAQISLAKPDERYFGARINMRTEFNFQYRIYDINKNFESEKDVWMEGVHRAMDNSAAIVHATNTGDELLGSSREKIAELIEQRFMGMHDPKDKMLIEEWGIEVLAPITVELSMPESHKVTAAYDNVRIGSLEAEYKIIEALNLAQRKQLLTKGKFTVYSDENGQRAKREVLIDDYDLLKLSDKKVLDALQIENERMGKQEVIIDSRGDPVLNSLVKAYILNQKIGK